MGDYSEQINILSLEQLKQRVLQLEWELQSYRSNDNRYKLLFEQSLDATAFFLAERNDSLNVSDYILINCNKAFEALVGKNEKKLKSLNLQTVFVDFCGNLLQRLIKSSVDESNHKFEYSWQGHNRYFEISTSFPGTELLAVTFHDITQQKHIEEQIKFSEELFSRAFINSPEAFAILSLGDGKLIDINNKFCEIINYKRDEIVGKKPSELGITVSDYSISQLIEGLQHGRVENVEFRLQKHSGNIIQCLLSATQINFKGRGCVFAQLRDISELKEAEARLQERENFLITLIDNQGEGLVMSDQNETVVFANLAAEEIYGLPEGSFLGRSLFEFVDSGQAAVLRKQTLQRKQGIKNTYELTISQPNGQKRCLLVTAVPQYGSRDGEWAGSLAIFRDISDRKQMEIALAQSEQNYRHLVNMMPEALIVHSEGKIVFTNDRSLQLICAGHRDQVVGHDVLEFVQEQSRPTVIKRMKEVVEMGSSLPVMLEKIKCLDGNILDAEVTAIPLIYMGKKSAIVIIRDVSERLKSETELNQSHEQLRQLNATKDKLFSIIAHDLRNPFNQLLGFSELLLSNHCRYEPERREKFITQIYQASKQGYNLLENLLEWSRSQTGNISFRPQLFDIKIVVYEVVSQFENTAHIKNIKLTSNLSQKSTVFADENMLKAVMRNLLSNAIKFSHAGSQVQIVTRIRKDYMEVGIIDSGIGIETENIEKLFRPDINYSTPGTAREKGTGLGLLICKEFIERNAGKIWVESSLGKGSKFNFTLPIHP